MGSMKLIPGKSIKGDANNRHDDTDILNVKSFYEQDSHVMPESLKEIHVAITEGIDNLWLFPFMEVDRMAMVSAMQPRGCYWQINIDS